MKNKNGWEHQQRGCRTPCLSTSAQRLSETPCRCIEKWVDAEKKLWISESKRELTTIGHLCREAMQLFATSLVEQYKLTEVDMDPAHTIARVRAVLKARRGGEAGDGRGDPQRFSGAVHIGWRPIGTYQYQW